VTLTKQAGMPAVLVTGLLLHWTRRFFPSSGSGHR